MPDTRPRIVFDEEGVCNACRHADRKREINWEDRKKEFLEIVDKYRTGSSPWDCVVPWSGGKDSSSIAYKLKFEFGLNPLLVTFSPMIPNEVGMRNREALSRQGFDHIYVRPNQKVMRRLGRRFFIERGNQKVCWDAGVNVIPVLMAVKFGIKLIFYAEHGESEYGGKVIHEESTKIRDFTEVIEHQIGDDPRNWVDEEITLKELQPYVYPDPTEIEKAGIKALYFAYFFRWSMLENYTYIKDKISFETCPYGRTQGTFTNFDSLDDKTDELYYHMQYVKFGFGRATRDACRMIQNNQMSRAEGLELALRYDAEFPSAYLKENLEYLNMNEEEFHSIIDKHRNTEIWRKEQDQWKLINPPE